ncbi:hypothetical protein [Micromonospora qiuiae]|nr:hypothetical protein [Micromonospora qiuiae]
MARRREQSDPTRRGVPDGIEALGDHRIASAVRGGIAGGVRA